MARPNWVYKVVEKLGNSIRVQEFNVCKVTCHIFRIPCELIAMATKPIKNIDMLRPTKRATFSGFIGKIINIYITIFSFILF